MSFARELLVAKLAVQRATLLTQKVFHTKAKGTLSKDDQSPVTIGDFGAQALIIHALKHAFPSDSIVGEEEASELRQNASLMQQIWSLVQTTRLEDDSAEAELGGPLPTSAAMLDAIDAGNSAGGPTGRFWALDPIDGTKGFLRGGQYAVCLALIADGDVKVGVLGCPNLPIDDQTPLSAAVGDPTTTGVLFAAVAGRGATSQPLVSSPDVAAVASSIHMKSPLLHEATFCESVEAGHSSHGDQAAIASRLGIVRPSVRMDSQAKYGSIARGAADIYLRLPVRASKIGSSSSGGSSSGDGGGGGGNIYREKIWDHAAGDLIVREAGGIVTDARGKRLDFSQGRTLAENVGVVAAAAALHAEVLRVVEAVLGSKEA